MKFTCEKHLLQTAVATALRAVSGKSPIPALEGILVEAGNSVRVTGYDLKKGIYTQFEADVTETGSVVISAKLFADIIRSLPDGIVSVSCEDGTMISITCAETDFSIMGIPADDYPELPAVDQQNAIALPENLLRTMIGQTIFAVSDSESRPIYTGALFEIEDQQLTVVAVDGYRLALRKETIEGGDNTACSFIVPGNSLSEVEKICADREDLVKIVVGSKHISFAIGDTVLISRRLEGEFLNYKNSIPGSFSTQVVGEKAAVLKAVERVSLIIDDKTKNPLRTVFRDQEIRFHCATALGRAEDRCPVDGSGDDLEIGFNNRYLIDALKAAPSETLKICVNNSNSPCIFLPGDDSDNFTYMVLPVRLKAGE